jgi:hypothetical protein
MHSHLLTWVMYIMGQMIHVSMKSYYSSKSQMTPWTSIRGYLVAHWPDLAFRFFMNTMVFLFWWDNQNFVNAEVHKFVPSLDVAFPLTPATAGIYGLFSDVLLGWITVKIPFLATRMPQLADSPVQAPIEPGK